MGRHFHEPGGRKNFNDGLRIFTNSIFTPFKVANKVSRIDNDNISFEDIKESAYGITIAILGLIAYIISIFIWDSVYGPLLIIETTSVMLIYLIEGGCGISKLMTLIMGIAGSLLSLIAFFINDDVFLGVIEFIVILIITASSVMVVTDDIIKHPKITKIILITESFAAALCVLFLDTVNILYIIPCYIGAICLTMSTSYIITDVLCQMITEYKLSKISADELCGKGCNYYESNKFTEAVECFEQAIEKGSLEALNKLAQCYHKGEGVNLDTCKAFELYRKSALAGNKEGQNSLGAFYFQGIGTKKDYIKALHWTQLSAEQDYAIAQNNLGIMLFGNGFGENAIIAHMWFEKAIEQDFPQAYKNLGICYRFGIGVPRDLYTAEALFIQAIEKGDTTAEDRLKDVRETIANERI